MYGDAWQELRKTINESTKDSQQYLYREYILWDMGQEEPIEAERLHFIQGLTKVFTFLFTSQPHNAAFYWAIMSPDGFIPNEDTQDLFDHQDSYMLLNYVMTDTNFSTREDWKNNYLLQSLHKAITLQLECHDDDLQIIHI